MNAANFFEHLNDTRYRRNPQGFYESFFQRANHPTRPLAFWIRYTLFSPKGRPQDAAGELWAIVFNGETGQHVALKQEVPLHECHFDISRFSVAVRDATLEPGSLQGSISANDHRIAWNLTFTTPTPPLLLLPLAMYERRFPPAKGLVGAPMAAYNGTITLDGETLDIEQWIGSQNHNWGSKHTDHYGWGQVAGFDSHPDSFLEMISARVKVAGIRLPYLTAVVLRHRGKEYALNSWSHLIHSHAALKETPDHFRLDFRSRTSDIEIAGILSAPKRDFVTLPYANPPGGTKQCLNSKLASCTLRVTNHRTGQQDTLKTAHRAAFEIIGN